MKENNKNKNKNKNDLWNKMEAQTFNTITSDNMLKQFFWVVRGCSYGGELARLSGLAHLGEISLSLRNSYEIQCVYMRSEPACLGEISPGFAGLPSRRDENFPYEQAQVGQPGKVGWSFP